MNPKPFPPKKKAEAEPAGADWEKHLPSKGVLQFRFKAKEVQVGEGEVMRCVALWCSALAL